MPIISGSDSAAKISGVTISGTAAAGFVPTASNASSGVWAAPPGFEIGYDQITAGVSVVSTTEATGTTIISCAPHTFDGALVIAQFYSPLVSTGTTVSSDVVVSLFEGVTQVARFFYIETPQSQNMRLPGNGFIRFTPTAGSHTYTVTAFTTNVTGTPSVSAGAGGTAALPPAFCRFTKV